MGGMNQVEKPGYAMRRAVGHRSGGDADREHHEDRMRQQPRDEAQAGWPERIDGGCACVMHRLDMMEGPEDASPLGPNFPLLIAMSFMKAFLDCTSSFDVIAKLKLAFSNLVDYASFFSNQLLLNISGSDVALAAAPGRLGG
jgi:hypothetical protein